MGLFGFFWVLFFIFIGVLPRGFCPQLSASMHLCMQLVLLILSGGALCWRQIVDEIDGALGGSEGKGAIEALIQIVSIIRTWTWT